MLSAASITPVVDDAALPFIRQHTEQWMAARAGRVTTSTFALALGFWSDEFALAHLRLPLRGRASRDARDAAAREAVSVGSKHVTADAADAIAVARTRCLAAVEAYNAELAAAVANGADEEKLASLDAGGWAVTREHAVAAAARGARDVACALGKEQEPAALLAVLGAFPNSYVIETGSVPLGGANLNLAASADGVLVFPALGRSEDATETALAKAVEAGLGSSGGFAKPTRKSKSKPRKPSQGGERRFSRSKPPSAKSAADDADDKNPWPVPENRVAVAVEVKVASPFVWSSSGLKSYNNQAQYKVDDAFDGARDRVAPGHVPQAQLEAAALSLAGTLVVSYSPVCGGADAGASLRMRYVPRDDAYVETALGVLLANAIAADGGSAQTVDSARREERRSAFNRLVRRTKRLASSAALVADLAPIPIPKGADESTFLRL